MKEKPRKPSGDYIVENFPGERLSSRTTYGFGKRVWALQFSAELEEEFAVIDANHPLAGQSLVFDVELVSVESMDG